MSVEETLKERGQVYGDYRNGVMDRAAMMEVLVNAYNRERGGDMPKEAEGMLWDIVNKLCRLSVTPHHVDSWHDIQGYAKLAEAFFDQPMAKQPIDTRGN